jgi:hypothetical protein
MVGPSARRPDQSHHHLERLMVRSHAESLPLECALVRFDSAVMWSHSTESLTPS